VPVIITVALTTTTITTKKKEQDGKKNGTVIKFTGKSPMGQPRATVFSQIQEESTNTGNHRQEIRQGRWYEKIY
jgi:hypothetical protein